MPLPSMDASGLQRGLDALGQALGRQRAIRNQQAAATASLAFRQKMNDRISELDRRRDLGGDWGEEMRTWASEAVSELETTFSDDEAKQAWQNSALSDMETKVPEFRKVQVDRMRAWTAADLEAGVQKAVDAAGNDDYGTLVMSTEALFGSQKKGISPSAYEVYGASAPKQAQATIDRGSDLFVQRSVDRIMTDKELTWAQKVEYLEAKRVQTKGLIDTYTKVGFRPSAATQAKMDDAWAQASAMASQEADKEWKTSDSQKLLAANVDATRAWSVAAQTGARFDPTMVKPLAAIVDDPKTHPAVREDARNLIKELTLQADRGVTADGRAAMVKATTEQYQALLITSLEKGGTPETLKNDIETWKAEGRLPVESYNDLMLFVGNAKGLWTDPQVKEVLEGKFGSLPAETRGRLTSRFLAQIGGRYKKEGERDAYRDPTTGMFKPDALTKLADTMVLTDKDKAMALLLGPSVVVNKETVKQYLDGVAAGKYVSALSPSDVASKARPYAVFLYDKLVEKLKSRDPKKPLHITSPAPSYDLYKEVGRPVWQLSGGLTATPMGIDKEGNVEWQIK